MSIKVYGASDDLIEIEGDVREEFVAVSDNEPNYLVTSNGVVVRIKYDDNGVWRITPVTGSSVIVQAPEDDDDNYSDVAEIAGHVNWVVHGISWSNHNG